MDTVDYFLPVNVTVIDGLQGEKEIKKYYLKKKERNCLDMAD